MLVLQRNINMTFWRRVHQMLLLKDLFHASMFSLCLQGRPSFSIMGSLNRVHEFCPHDEWTELLFFFFSIHATFSFTSARDTEKRPSSKAVCSLQSNLPLWHACQCACCLFEIPSGAESVQRSEWLGATKKKRRRRKSKGRERNLASVQQREGTVLLSTKSEKSFEGVIKDCGDASCRSRGRQAEESEREREREGERRGKRRERRGGERESKKEREKD